MAIWMERGTQGARWRIWPLAAVLALLSTATFSGRPAAAQEPPHPWFDGPTASELTVADGRFVDGHGREVVLRGFNVSGETKLAENDGLPFANTADARTSAQALRSQGGANSVRFLLSWAAAEPEPGRVDSAYLREVTAQMREFLAVGLRVYPDFHQDLFSRHLFHQDSWYTGDGAPRWVVEAGDYGREFCGVCVHWGQNITQNQAVKDATRDFWHNRTLDTDAGAIGVQDAFLDTAQTVLAHLAEHLSADEFARVIGFNPYNEPYAGEYEQGQDSRAWERDVLWPFYERFRDRMDAAGWRDKPVLVEPNMFWNANLDFIREEGGFHDATGLGPRYVLNTHFYDQRAISGVFMPGKAEDGQYTTDFGDVRERAAALDTTAIVSEFGHPLSGFTSDKAPTVDKAMYQALDSRLPGADWWQNAADSGPVLSATQWQWDIYNGRHHEAMNGNPDKILTEGDAWNDEDHSAVRLDTSGQPALRQDARLIDRLYPSAVAGRTLAFSYEDRSRDEGQTLTWNRIPDTLPRVAELVDSGRYGLLVWRAGDNGTSGAPTELHLPRDLDPATATVVSDLDTVTGLPDYTPDTPIAVAPEPGGTDARRLLISPPPGSDTPGTLHYALVAEGGADAPSPELREAAQRELSRWAAASGFPS